MKSYAGDASFCERIIKPRMKSDYFPLLDSEVSNGATVSGVTKAGSLEAVGISIW